MVLGWQFTKTTSLDEVKDLFLNVRGRIVDLSKIVIIVDNCCNVRGKLSEIFGPDITVKLDLFHAVQRLTRKLPKKHPMIHLCTNDFRLVFRSPADLGHTRMNSTADSDTILLNMDQFVMKWKECEKMLNVPAMKEIESLKVHVKKGCLSGLPIGAGTNKNERLHRHLRPHFSHTRLGLPMALSCMTIILHQYNEKKLGAASPAVSHCQYEDDENQFRFGIPDKECRHNNSEWKNNPELYSVYADEDIESPKRKVFSLRLLFDSFSKCSWHSVHSIHCPRVLPSCSYTTPRNQVC